MQSPAMESAERAAETIPGLSAAAAAVGLEDHRRMLRDHASRVADSYALGRKAFTDQQQDDGCDDMGDIVITGDIKITDPAQAAGVIDSLRGNDSSSPVADRPIQMPAKPRFRWAIPASIVTAGVMTAAGLKYVADNQSSIQIDSSSDVEVGFGQPQSVTR